MSLTNGAFATLSLAGYNTGVMNAPEAFVFPGHSTEQWSLAVSVSCVGAPFGCVLAGKWADSRGRRGALLLITWLFIIGGAIQSLATSINVVMIGRTVIGLSSGASTVLVPIYLGERECSLRTVAIQAFSLLHKCS